MKAVFKTLCLLAFLTLATQSHAQTKEETMKWLTEKMMSTGFFKEGGKEVKISKAYFDENYLIINYSVIWEEYDKKIRQYEKYDQSGTYTINLSKTKANFPFNTEGNYIKLNYRNIEYYREAGMDWAVWNDSNGEIYQDDIYLNVNYNFEPDILERFTKAIEHYKTLMTVKKSNEIF